LLLMARSALMQSALSRAFAQRRVDKRYVAVVQGQLRQTQQPWASIELPLALDWPRRPMSRVDLEHGKPSTTLWRVLPCPDDTGTGTSAVTNTVTTRVELQALTGRSHQLRLHLQALGHPIVGDSLYGNPVPDAASAQASRLLLHASQLAFRHPVSGQAMMLTSAAPF